MSDAPELSSKTGSKPRRDQAGAPSKRAPPKSARRRSREFALQGLYQWLISQGDPGDIDAHTRGLDGFGKADLAHYDALLYGCIREMSQLDQLVKPHIDRPMSELSPIEHGVLVIGAYEFQHCLDVPCKVVLNEAVELAKSFGGTDGYKYVNGVLDKLAAQLRPEEFKAGR